MVCLKCDGVLSDLMTMFILRSTVRNYCPACFTSLDQGVDENKQVIDF